MPRLERLRRRAARACARNLAAFDLVGHGCAAALPNWRIADALLAARRCDNVLSVCVEVSSAAMYLDNDPGVLVSACLFGDGAGARCSPRGDAPEKRRIEWTYNALPLNPTEREALRFEQRAGCCATSSRGPSRSSRPSTRSKCSHDVLGERGVDRAETSRCGSGTRAAATCCWRCGAGSVSPTTNALQRGDAARVRQPEQRVRLFRARGGARATRAPRRLVVDVVVRCRLQLSRRTARRRMSASARTAAVPAAMAARASSPSCSTSFPPNDPRALRSRRDLRRVNRIMGLARDLAASARHGRGRVAAAPRRARCGRRHLDAASGARRARRWPGRRSRCSTCSRVVDAHDARRDYGSSVGTVEVVAADVFDWLEHSPPGRDAVVFANLFVHHFDRRALRDCSRALRRIAPAFVCCEPRRSRAVALVGSHLLGLIGCNDVTRHDAVISVHAGFRERELTAAWPSAAGRWHLAETPAGAVQSLFVARRSRDALATTRSVIGGGVAGGTAAILLAQAGWSVALVEKHDRSRGVRSAASASPHRTSRCSTRSASARVRRARRAAAHARGTLRR